MSLTTQSPSHTPLPAGGVIAPMITPLLPDGRVDIESTAQLTYYLAEAGVNGLLVLGSSGENAALSAADRRAAVSCVVDAAAGVHVMAGVPSLGTADATHDAADFAALGADSLLVAAPFGFQLSQVELAGHFTTVAKSVGVPVVAYEVPSRVGVSLGTPLLIQLAADEVIAGAKDSSGNLGAARLRSRSFRDHGLGSLPHFTGSEECIDAFLLGGGTGCIPGLANVFPEFHVTLYRQATANDWMAAAHTQGRIVSLLELYFQALPGASFSAQFFGIVKEALVQRGVIACNTSATPFVEADEGITQHVARLLRKADDLWNT